MNLLDLPEEVLKKIASYLSFNDKKSLFFVHQMFFSRLKKNQVLFIHSKSNWRSINVRLPYYKTLVLSNAKDTEYFPIDTEYHVINVKKIQDWV
jgi:hypothetical protein